jgi:hypothetical protein
MPGNTTLAVDIACDVVVAWPDALLYIASDDLHWWLVKLQLVS